MKTLIVILLGLLIFLTLIALIVKPSSIYKNNPSQRNPMEGKYVAFIFDDNDRENADGVKGHLEEKGNIIKRSGIYENIVKRVFDVVFSFVGMLVLTPLFLCLSFLIIIDDPGPVLFTQKRIGKNKQYFKLHKFRSMRMSAPHDVPTHMLENPYQYTTRVGKFIRKHSLDELPQIWDIFIGNMSIIGPRPALWNQDLLTAERDKYGANDVKPGLTGWAQVNGRDSIKIEDKAKLDGEYVSQIGIRIDSKCLFDTVHVFIKDDSMIEGINRKME